MEKNFKFEDFDDANVYEQSLTLAREEPTRNFIVEFGKDEAHIAFDVNAGHLTNLLEAIDDPNPTIPRRRPVRWINLWGPHRQLDIVNLLGDTYRFSPRLLAIIRSTPRDTTQKHNQTEDARLRVRPSPKDDPEVGETSVETSRDTTPPATARSDTTHYDIARQMVNYHSIDFGSRFLCVGANWMHNVPAVRNDEDDPGYMAEDGQHRLWSWLIMCDDNTIISLHEQPASAETTEHVEAMRSNTISVLSQLSTFGHDCADPISMQTVRQVLESSSKDVDPGVEGASNLFYYLFDDWRSVYMTVASFRLKLEVLRKLIIEDMAAEKSITTPNISIIPRLHMLGLHIRQMQHLYEGYKNLIDRILEPVRAVLAPGRIPLTRNLSGFGIPGARGFTLAPSASNRFERLSDRLQLLILSQTTEFLAEKEALTDSYFNLLARKDSEATSRLTRAATLLAKLSVLFLPVSLMTSYFSVQIPDIQGRYTLRQYWDAFAIIMSVSFCCLFFLDKSLMVVTESLSGWAHRGSAVVGKGVTRTLGRKRRRT